MGEVGTIPKSGIPRASGMGAVRREPAANRSERNGESRTGAVPTLAHGKRVRDRSGQEKPPPPNALPVSPSPLDRGVQSPSPKPPSLKPPRVTGRRLQAFNREVYRKYGSVCWLCGEDIDMTLKRGPMRPTVDHIVPFDEDPSLELVVDNCRPAHATCNSSRQKKDVNEYGILPIKKSFDL